MAFFLLLTAFFLLIFLSIEITNTRISIVKGVIFFSLAILFITELLSIIKSVNYLSLVIFWCFFDLLLVYFFVRYQTSKKIKPLFIKFKNRIKELGGLEKGLVFFSILLLFGIFMQGLFYPTNNWDSMAYHMPRIIHWIQNESLTHFRTPVYPQLNSPPFAEQFLLNVNLLLGNDYLSNTVQLFYFICSGFVVSLIAKTLGLDRLGQILTVFIIVSLPEAVLLASSTHTELIASFFMLTSIYFLIKTIHNKSIINFILLGAALGLSVATKSTAYIYLSGFVFVWILVQLYQFFIKKQRIKWFNGLVLGLVFVVINSGHYTRNYSLTGSVFGTNQAIDEYYVNEAHAVRYLASNISRNISIQFGLPHIAPIVQSFTEKIHNTIGVNINEPKITSHKYSVDPLAIHENNGANTFHMLLLLLSSIWIVIFFKNENYYLKGYWLAIICSFLLFCFYLKWQPWAKLHIPFFIFYGVIIAHFLVNVIKSKVLLSICIIGFLIHSIAIFLFNYSRPIITLTPFTSAIKITDTRYKKHFSRFLRCHDDYKVVTDMIRDGGYRNIGLLFGSYDMEYQLFLNSYNNKVKPIHINAHDICSKIKVKDRVDVIVSTQNIDSLTYEGENYQNVTMKNDGYLYLFLKK